MEATMATKSLSAPQLASWQPAAGNRATAFSLAALDPAAKPWSSGDKEADKTRVDALAMELDGLQDQFYADRRFKLLVVLQGTDTSGKDGTVRSVFSRTSPLGVHTVGWKAPSDADKAHDYLWRIHKVVPGAGEMMIFNRSHYEDVLVPVVNGWITPAQVKQRYQQINDFERLLVETGTVVLKFMLHISFEEQGKRLQERVDDPTKHWKFSMDDLTVRKQWPEYQKAYQALLRATSTTHAPWTIVPANSKTHRNLMIATVVRDTLKKLKLRYPPSDARLAGLKIR